MGLRCLLLDGCLLLHPCRQASTPALVVSTQVEAIVKEVWSVVIVTVMLVVVLVGFTVGPPVL
jgi:hypothetical protein